MNTNPDEPAYPCTQTVAHPQTGEVTTYMTHPGLTKREHFAAMFHAAFASNPSRDADHETDARDAVKAADALLAALNQPRP